ncbi:hypothetical protein [Paraglaciecola sp. MB-3u-78]|uniref:hypothetical protein n=1 Tax=Paraglaciecola sp. MB-3u-78 TaxID=2058332 RepID=UPI000C341882|nr:hypothetical protein [Paraglaciecola sp. MB-3u-78]PKG96982.1 hypothetical protein CXF95_21995 [Paraglaciecola sp. MB-3u-78]
MGKIKTVLSLTLKQIQSDPHIADRFFNAFLTHKPLLLNAVLAQIELLSDCVLTPESHWELIKLEDNGYFFISLCPTTVKEPELLAWRMIGLKASINVFTTILKKTPENKCLVKALKAFLCGINTSKVA